MSYAGFAVVVEDVPYSNQSVNYARRCRKFWGFISKLKRTPFGDRWTVKIKMRRVYPVNLPKIELMVNIHRNNEKSAFTKPLDKTVLLLLLNRNSYEHPIYPKPWVRSKVYKFTSKNLQIHFIHTTEESVTSQNYFKVL